MAFLNMTMRTKLIAIGAATAIGFASLVGIGWIAGERTATAISKAETVKREVETVIAMRTVELQMILAAMDAIVDKDEGAIDPERVTLMADALAEIKAGEATAGAVAEKVGEPAAMQTFAADIAQVEEAVTVTLPKLIETRADADAFAAIDDAIDAGGERLYETLTTISDKGNAFVLEHLALAAETARTAKMVQTITALAFLLVVGGGIATAGRDLFASLKRLGDDMTALSSGRLDHEIIGAERNDEIGTMARSLVEFRRSAVEKVRMESEVEGARHASESERNAREAAKQSEDAMLARAVTDLAEALGRLSSGDLSVRIDTAFDGTLERLRLDFNASVEKLSDTLSGIAKASNEVLASSNEIGTATDDLSRRTEQQAASLEETAAALDEITATVRQASQRADEASEMVGSTKASAEKSGAVVRNAIEAMEKIEDSSRRISQIIVVIDEIAFQTNLLALNAGVEAARAGEAGRGFAVVAQEVRELAQRSANAAKEIKTLIETSSNQVGAGVSLVNDTGAALTEIEGQVAKINGHIQSIVTASREQSTALTEINAAINQMDQVTQQNAAMVEQTNAATQGLAGEASTLGALVGGFRLGHEAASGSSFQSQARGSASSQHAAPRAPARPVAFGSSRPASQAARLTAAPADARPKPSPARALGEKLAGAFPAAKANGSADSWEEF